MKFAWCKNVSDLAVWNSRLVEEIDLDVYCDMLDVDEMEDTLDKDDDEMVLDY